MSGENQHTPDLSGYDDVRTLTTEDMVREHLANGWELITCYMGVNPANGAEFPVFLIGRTAVFEFREDESCDDPNRSSREGWHFMGVFSRKIHNDNSGGGYAHLFRRRKMRKE